VFTSTPGRIESPENSSTHDTGHQSTDVTHVFWHTEFVPENVSGELLRQAGIVGAVICPSNGRFTSLLNFEARFEEIPRTAAGIFCFRDKYKNCLNNTTFVF
jgi:hypothetical protein